MRGARTFSRHRIRRRGAAFVARARRVGSVHRRRAAMDDDVARGAPGAALASAARAVRARRARRDDDDDDDDATATTTARDGRARDAVARARALMARGRYAEAKAALDGAAVGRDDDDDDDDDDDATFALAALRAELPYHLNDARGSLDAMCAVHAMCAREAREARGAEAREAWRRRRDAAARGVARRHMLGDDPRAALVWLDALARSEPDEPAHFSAAGRAHLMMGDLEGARLCFEAAEKKTAALGEAATEAQRGRVLRDRGDYFLTGLRFPEARTAFAAAMAKGETDVAAKVNSAVAAVYDGDLNSSRALLESGLANVVNADVNSKARAFISPSVVKNLNSIYELTARSPAEAKRAMNDFIKLVAPEDFDVTCMAT